MFYTVTGIIMLFLLQMADAPAAHGGRIGQSTGISDAELERQLAALKVPNNWSPSLWSILLLSNLLMDAPCFPWIIHTECTLQSIYNAVHFHLSTHKDTP